MKGEYKTEFQRALWSLPKNKYNDVSDEIMTELEWSPSTFRKKLIGETRIKNPEMCMLKNIFKQYNIKL